MKCEKCDRLERNAMELAKDINSLKHTIKVLEADKCLAFQAGYQKAVDNMRLVLENGCNRGK